MTKGPVAAGLGRVEELSDAGDYEAALTELDRALEEHPLEPSVHTARGWALENLGPSGSRRRGTPTSARSSSTRPRSGRRKGCRTSTDAWATSTRPTDSRVR